MVSNKKLEPWENILDPKGAVKPMSFGEFIREYDSFSVPVYQRPYSWGARETKQFYEDLVLADNSGKPWYLGIIYVLLHRGKFDKVIKAEILDGQQRITTFFLLLIAVRKRLWDVRASVNQDYAKMAAELGRLYGSGKKYSCRLNLTKEWMDFLGNKSLLKLMETPTAIAGKETEEWETVRNGWYILSAKGLKGPGALSVATAIRNHRDLEGWLEDLPPKNVQGLIDGFDDFLWILHSPLTKTVESKLLFEGINSRGKKLDLLDKLRFRLLSDNVWRSGQHRTAYYSVEKLESDWGLVFAEIQRLLVSKAVKNEDSAFELFMRGKDGRKYPSNMGNHEEWIDEAWFQITGKKGGNLDKLLVEKWMQEFIHFLRLFALFADGKDGNVYQGPRVVAKEIFGVASTESNELALIREGLAASENYKWFLCCVLREYAAKEAGHYAELWERALFGVGLLYVKYFINGEESNEFRSSMFTGGRNKVCEYSLSAVQDISHRGLGLDNKDARFFLLLASYLGNDDWDIIRSRIEWPRSTRPKLKYPNADHFCPVSWSKNWSVIADSCAGDVVTSTLDDRSSTLDIQGSTDSIAAWWKGLEPELFELIPGEPAPKGSIINWLGNKWVLDFESNLTKRNHNHSDGLELYGGKVKVRGQSGQHNGYVLPSHKLENVGWGVLEEKVKSELVPWDGKRIVERTFAVHEYILNRLKQLEIAPKKGPE